MNLDALLDALGYRRYSERRWVTPETADPRLNHYYRLAQRAGEKAGAGASIVGSYVFQTSMDDKLTPPRPAVFVAQAQNDQQARAIHKSLWNMGDCPFVIVVLPGVVRIYTGFAYASDGSRGKVIPDVSDDLMDTLPEPLLPFHANEIDSGLIWQKQAKRLTSETRVDYLLLAYLEKLSRHLQKHPYNLSREVAHALIGKYIYFHYLRDREILDEQWLAEHNIASQDIFGRHARATAFDALSRALQARFNGDIFPLPESDAGIWRQNAAISFLAGIFEGDSPDGQLALDFRVYDFSYIPVELLSSIYEQFLKDEGKGKGDGVVYTPEPLADYVLAEMEAVRPLTLTDRTLDPCCGSGVFLVLTYRRLIEKLWQEQGTRPSAEEMKRLLQSNIFGVEKDGEACHITAFSLILTLLSHLEPPELNANADFQFPTLVGSNIFHADFFDASCPVFANEMRFERVVGNPPWDPADGKNPDHKATLTWIKEAARIGRHVGKLRMDEAFSWRVGDTLVENGCAGLLIMATSLVNSSSASYRKNFFRTFAVRRITNLSRFFEILFVGPKGRRGRAPAACLIYQKDNGTSQRQPILHFGPLVANQSSLLVAGVRRRFWTITLYEGDIQEIDYSAAISDEPCLWKTALLGGSLDRRALRRLGRLLPKTLGDIEGSRHWILCGGPHIKSPDGKSTGAFVKSIALKGKKIIETDALSTRFAINDDALSLLSPEQEFFRDRGGSKGIQLIPAPHMLITAEQAVYSDKDFVIPAPKVGIAVGKADSDYLKAVACYLNSSVARYAHFFNSALWGIFISTINPENVRAIPMTDFSAEQIQQLASAYDGFAERERAYLSEYPLLATDLPDLQPEVDKIVEATLRIPDSIGSIAREFMSVRYQLIKGKLGDSAIEPPTPEQLKEYAYQLRLQIDDFARRRHKITIQTDNRTILASVEVTRETEPIEPTVVQSWNTAARQIMAAVQEQHSQWAYVQRSVRLFAGPSVHIIKSARLLDWTRTQAIQDSADLIAEVLDKTAPRNE